MATLWVCNWLGLIVVFLEIDNNWKYVYAWVIVILWKENSGMLKFQNFSCPGLSSASAILKAEMKYCSLDFAGVVSSFWENKLLSIKKFTPHICSTYTHLVQINGNNFE